MNSTRAYAGTQSVVRALRLLKLFHRASPEITFAELRERSALNRSTLFRLLTALEAEGLIERNRATEGFRLGPQIAALGRRAVGDGDLTTLAQGKLEAIAARTHETATLEVLAEDKVVILAEATSAHVLGALPSLGTSWPAHATSTGKVLLAALEGEERRRVLPPQLERFTERTLTDTGELERELERSKRDGYALSCEELEPGYVAVAVPVLDAGGRTVAALSIGGPKHRLGEAELRECAAVLTIAARELTRELGG